MTGHVDDKSRPRVIHLFAGAGGGVLGGHILGWNTVCAVELDPFCRETLVARQNDGTVTPFPIWDDVRTFDGKPWAGKCDILCGGFPCQNISPLGDRSGIRGDKSSLWGEFARIIREIRPAYAFIENSSDLIKLGLDVVLRDLDEIGYDAEWRCLSAGELGAPHIRDRVWVLAKLVESGIRQPDAGTGGRGGENIGGGESGTSREEVQRLADSDPQRCEEQGIPRTAEEAVHTVELPDSDNGGEHIQYRTWESEPGVGRMADGVANGVERLAALGNGQVPDVAAAAFIDLYSRFCRYHDAQSCGM